MFDVGAKKEERRGRIRPMMVGRDGYGVYDLIECDCGEEGAPNCEVAKLSGDLSGFLEFKGRVCS